MSRLKKISLVAFVLLITGIVGSVLTVNTNKESSPINEEKVFDGGKITNITIDSENADIDIIPVEGIEVKVELHGTGSKNRQYNLNVDDNNGTLMVELKEKYLKFFNFNFMDTGLTLKVYVPEKDYDSIKINNINGRIKANQFFVNEMEAVTVNGAIELENIVSANIKVQSDNGEIFLEDTEGDIQGDLLNGGIFVKSKNIHQNIDLENVNGEIEIVTEEKPTNVEIDAEVLNGKSILFGKIDSHLHIGNGDYRVNLKTLNGGISVSQN